MNLKIPNEGLSFFFMTAGIMNPMMVMRILDWVFGHCSHQATLLAHYRSKKAPRNMSTSQSWPIRSRWDQY
jgi:1,4-alpha-glucan branching enzyme